MSEILKSEFGIECPEHLSKEWPMFFRKLANKMSVGDIKGARSIVV